MPGRASLTKPRPKIQDFWVGDRIVLTNAPARYETFRGHHGVVMAVIRDPRVGMLLSLRIDNHEEKILTDIGADFVDHEPVDDGKRPRRGVLNLKSPEDDRSEKEIQVQIIRLLESLGYKVMDVGQTAKPRPCKECGTYNDVSGGGTYVGYPDLTVTHPRHWRMDGRSTLPTTHLEVKASEKADRRPEQEMLAALGLSAFIWSERMAAERIFRFECDTFAWGPNPLLVAWMEASGILPEGRKKPVRKEKEEDNNLES